MLRLCLGVFTVTVGSSPAGAKAASGYINPENALIDCRQDAIANNHRWLTGTGYVLND
jgi:hypothetical protein